MKKFLDISITLRQIFRWLHWCFYLLISIYIYLFISNEWQIKMGGANVLNSPYLEFIPEACKKPAGVTSAGYMNDTSTDSLLLRHRFKRVTLANPVQDFSSANSLTCLGYVVISGLHEQEVGIANFTQQFQDAKGKPVVTVRVEYHQSHPYPPVDLIEELKARKQ